MSPVRLATPIFNLYDSTTDPGEYVMRYHNAIHTLRIVEDNREAMLFKMFTVSFIRPTFNWFYGLEKGSITSFEKFIKIF